MNAKLHHLAKRIALLILLTAVHSASAFYDPHIGRWINRDPVGEEGSDNLHNFISNNAVNSVDVLGLYQFGGLQATYGVNASGGEIGGRKQGATGGRLGIVKLDTELKDCNKKCCLKALDTKLTLKVYLPNVGDTLTGVAGWSFYAFTVTATQQANIREHEQLHVNAHFRIAGTLCPKLESDCTGKCETRWFGRAWTAKTCDDWWRKKIEGELDWVKGKIYKAADTLDTWTRYFNENVSLGQQFTDNYNHYCPVKVFMTTISAL